MNLQTTGLRWLPLAMLGVALAGCTPFHAPQQSTPAVSQPASRWVPVAWSALPGWDDDRIAQAWPALLRSCQKPTAAWTAVCADARAQRLHTDDAVRRWFEQNLAPYSIQSLQGSATGLLTGYYEPVLVGSRRPTAQQRHPLHALPADLIPGRPYWTRQQIDTLPAAKASLRGREIAHVADPLDAFALHVQGSGRLQVTEPDGRVRTVRLAYAGTNDQPYQSIGRWLIDRGEVPPGQASWPQIRAWAERNPARVNEMLWANPRYVFFREEHLPDPTQGPRGAQGVPLTPGRSIAVDPQSLPYGTPVWIESSDPITRQPLRRIVLAQDTGSAIKGAVRADYFWGWGPEAAAQAGRTQQPLRMWALWPRN
jgi:membrane-bound lytic murein transglycosylase A